MSVTSSYCVLFLGNPLHILVQREVKFCENLTIYSVNMSKLEDLEFPFCRDAMTVYEKLAKIGQGTFG